MITFSRETVGHVLDEIKPLLHMHWREIATFEDIPLAPDFVAYRNAEGRHALRIFTARAGGALVGYAVFFVGNLHYQGSGIATQDILFLRPDHRGGRTGLRLVNYCDEQLASEGVQVVYQHVKLEHPQLGRVLSHAGYRPVETIYTKRLDNKWA